MPDERPGPITVGQKLAARLKARGPREVLALGTERVREFLSSEDRLIAYTRTTHRVGGEALPKDLTFRTAEPSDAGAYARDIGTDSARTFAMRQSGGTLCWLVLKGDLIVHATWGTFSSAWTRELRRYFCPPPGDLYAFESYTRPEVRGRGVYTFALRRIAMWAGERGTERLWVAVEHDNPPSLKAVAKAGFEPAFEVSFRRRWGRIEISPLEGPGAEDCNGCLSETPCRRENLRSRG